MIRSALASLRNPKMITCVLGVLLSLSALRFLVGFRGFYGVDPYDESLYLQLAEMARFRVTWSPLYVLYYMGLLLFTSGDALVAYFYNIAFLSFALPVLHFFLMRRLAVDPLIAFLSSYFVLIASFNAPLISKAGHFNLMILYAGLIGISFLKDRFRQLTALYAVSIFTVFIRQDMIIVALVALLALAIYLKMRTGAIEPRERWVLWQLLNLTCLLFLLFGNVLSSERSWQVFTDTYHVNSAGPRDIDRITNVEGVFGKAKSISAAALANPTAFASHVRQNFRSFPATLSESLPYHFPLTGAELKEASARESYIFLAIAAVFLLASALIRLRRGEGGGWRRGPFDLVVFVASAGLFLKTLLVVGVFWHGTPRYFLEGIIALLILVTILLDRVKTFTISPWLAYGLGLALFLAVPNHAACTDCRFPHSIPAERSVKEFVEYMRGRKEKGKTCFYAGNFGVYLYPKFKCIAAGNPWFYSYPSRTEDKGELSSLRAYLTAKRFDYILVNPSMRDLMKEYGKEVELKEFERNYRDWGFDEKVELKPGEFVIFRR